MRKAWAAVLAAVWLAACGSDSQTEPRGGPQEPSGAGGPTTVLPDAGGTPQSDGGEPDAGEPDAGEPDAGEPDGGESDGGEPDGGEPDGGEPDGGEPDGGEPDGGQPDAGPTSDLGPTPTPPPEGEAGPWPTAAVTSFTEAYGVGVPDSVGVDTGRNVWLLQNGRIGVLRAGASAPEWTSNLGQAGRGFTATVICGGAPGRAYVGYYADDSLAGFVYSPDGCEFPAYTNCDPGRFDPARYRRYQDGDADVVRIGTAGAPVLEEHLARSYGTYRGKFQGPQDLGIRNTNDHHFDEDRAILSCATVLSGRDRGDVYVGSNHGVTRIRGLQYSSHRHPVWMDGSTQMAGFTYGLGIAPNGDVLIANDWNFGIVTPNPDFGYWYEDFDESINAMPVKSSYLEGLNGQAAFDFWRGFQQTKDGRYFLASAEYGLWEMTLRSKRDPAQPGTKVAGLPTDQLTSLAATNDGSLYIGTATGGLWRRAPNGTLSRVTEVGGNRVKQLVYDGSVSPGTLYVLTSSGLYALRGM